MEDQHERGAILFVVAIVVLAALIGAAAFFTWQNRQASIEEPQPQEPTVTNFDECSEHYAVMESYPRQCATPDGRTFTEDIGNELEKQDIIRVDSPRPNEIVGSPLAITGMARGPWFFEASFPVRLLDENGDELASGIATADGEWMTEEFVPFTAELEFLLSGNGKGTLILEKDNPSGLPENDDSLVVPVRF
ncbi:MAG: Gmad2 immunoglobulin-like domain-containing protein [Candidatus Spechtbacterales bacterium]